MEMFNMGRPKWVTVRQCIELEVEDNVNLQFQSQTANLWNGIVMVIHKIKSMETVAEELYTDNTYKYKVVLVALYYFL